MLCKSFQPSNMERTTTETFNFERVRFLSLPTWENGPLTVRGDDVNIDIYQVSQKQIRDEILSFVRSMGYATGDLSEISGFLSDLADTVATARTRVEDDLAKKAEA